MKTSNTKEWLPLALVPGRQAGNSVPPVTGSSSQASAYVIPLFLATPVGLTYSGHDTEITFIRIVGQLRLRLPASVSPATEWWSLSIMAPLQFDHETGVIHEQANAANSPAEFESHARPEVMWQRFFSLQRSLSDSDVSRDQNQNFIGTQGYASSVVDIRVKRKIRDGEALVMKVTNHWSANTLNFELTMALKALVNARA